MQTINQLTAKINLTTSTASEQKQGLSTETQTNQATSELSAKLLNLVIDLFADWKLTFGTKLKDRQNLDLRTAELWTIALQELKITPSEFKKAWLQSLTLEWTPTAPVDFLNLARASNDYTDPIEAFQIACSESGKMPEARKWTDSVIYETAMRCNPTVLAMCLPSYSKRFTAIYRGVIEEHRAGAEFIIPKPLVAIENKHKPVSKEWIDNLLANAKFGKKTA